MSDRPCSEWNNNRCIIAATDAAESLLCTYFEVCMYAAERETFTPEQLEALDAWAHARVCLLAFSPLRRKLAD
jgi:hypothetical protein